MKLHDINYTNETVTVNLMSLLHLRPTAQLNLSQKKFPTQSVSAITKDRPDQEVRIPQKQNILTFAQAMLNFDPTQTQKTQDLRVSHPPLHTGITTQGSENTQVSSELTFSSI